jgi:uncharacterized repeat protein (TIGR03803 family)
MKRMVNALGKLNRGKRAYDVFVLCAATAIALPAQTLTSLFSFDGTDGAFPQAGLVQATNGDFYGTTVGGGANNSCYQGGGCGTVFKITLSGTLTTLYSFCPQSGCPDGTGPEAGLVQATNGDFYGTTAFGGVNVQTFSSGAGTVFKITSTGTLTTLYSFCTQSFCPDGAIPYAGLVQGTDGNLYGTTQLGGDDNAGTVFKITPSGTLTTLYSFCALAGCTDGYYPDAGLVQATDGNFYGTTEYGGSHSCDSAYGGCGTVFKITPSGTLTTLYSFCTQSGCTDGYTPSAVLFQATNGDLYGTIVYGGANDTCTPQLPPGCGTIFRLSVGLGPFVETRLGWLSLWSRHRPRHR